MTNFNYPYTTYLMTVQNQSVKFDLFTYREHGCLTKLGNV